LNLFSINSASLEKQLADQSVLLEEIKNILDFVSKMYCENVERIVALCDKEMMALEYVPSPLKLFVDCLVHVQKSLSLSLPASRLIQRYPLAWEDWMKPISQKLL
jgi:hypothetical protein